MIRLLSKGVEVWKRLRTSPDGVPRKPYSRYKVYDGETVQNSLERIPFLQQFIMRYDEFERIHANTVRYNANAVNEYMGETVVRMGGPITIKVINTLLKTAKGRGELS